MLPADAAHLNATAVQAATEAMLAVGFGHWGGGEHNGDDEQHHNMAAQLQLATAHTATAASSLSALPSSAFFSSLRLGEGVDCLDIIGHPQWRHAIILDSRNEEQEFLVRWAGWDAKWDEWVHCLRLSPAHSKVLGDTGPEDSAEKTTVAVLGGEWLQLRRSHPTLLSDVRITIEGRTPWAIMQRMEQQLQQQQAFETNEFGSLRGSPPHPRPRGPPSQHHRAFAFGERHAASSTPPSHARSYASLDPDDDEDDNGGGYEHTGGLDDDDDFSLLGSSSSTSPPRRRPSSHQPVQHAHESFLRVRCPRLFKFERDPFTNGNAHAASSTSAASVASSPAGASSARRFGEQQQQPHEFRTPQQDTASAFMKNGNKTAPASTIAAATAAASAEERKILKQQQMFSGSMKLPLSKARSSQRLEHPSLISASAITSASSSALPPTMTGPPSARLARSSSALLKPSPSGSQTARSATAARSTLSRQASASSSLTSSPAVATKNSRKSAPGAGAAPLSPPALAHAASTPASSSSASSAPNSAARRLFAASNTVATPPKVRSRNSAGASTTAAAAVASVTPSRSRTPNVSAPATPRLLPAASSASPRASPSSFASSSSPSSSPSPSPPPRKSTAAGGAAAKTKPRATGTAGRPATASAAQSKKRASAASSSASAIAASSSSATSPVPQRSVSDPQSSPSSSLLSSTVPSSGSCSEIEADDVEENDDDLVVAASAAAAGIADDSLLAETILLSSVTASAIDDASASSAPSTTLFPKDSSSAAAAAATAEECKEQPPSVASVSTSSPSSIPPSRPIVPPFKLLVLPLSSPKALAAFVEYVYSDNIVHTATGDRLQQRAAAAAAANDAKSNKARAAAAAAGGRSASSSRSHRYPGGQDWSDSDEEVAAASSGHPSAAAAGPPSSSSTAAMDVFDLLELACLGSSLHDARLVCLASLHLQRGLKSSNILGVLHVLEVLGALEHKALRDRQAAEARALGNPTTTLSVFLNGCLAPTKSDHATHPTQSGNKATSVSSPSAVPTASSASISSPSAATATAAAAAAASPLSIPASFLAADTPSTFLRDGGINLCGSSTHDLDLVTRLSFEWLLVNWTSVFLDNQGHNMRALHAMPFETFSMIVNLKNQGNGGSAGAGAGAAGPGGEGGNDGAAGAGGGGNAPYVFTSVQQKAIYNQAQINAALIAAGIQPTLTHNLFLQAHMLGGGVAGGPGANGGGGSVSHNELLQLIAAPSIALPACGLLKTLKKLYDTRSEATCDVKIIIEDDSDDNHLGNTDASGPPPQRRVKAVLWAHKIVLACGSEFFRTFFGGGNHGAAGGWDQSLQLHSASASASSSPSSSSPTRVVSCVRFPSSSFTIGSLEVVLRYIYTNESARGINFSSALHCMNQHVTTYFGLRSYTNGVHSSITNVEPSSSASLLHAPASFSCDLEKSCIAILHAALNNHPATGVAGAGGAAASPSLSSSSSSSLLPPSALECLHLIQSAFHYGDRSLFEKGCTLLDWGQLSMMMASALQRRRDEEQRMAHDRKIKRERRREAAASQQRPPPTASASSPTTSTLASSERKDTDDDSVFFQSELDSASDTDSDFEQPQPRPFAASSASSSTRLSLHSPHSSISSPSASSAVGSALDLEFIAAVLAEKARAAAAAAAVLASNNSKRA